jgi:hypothetical protein
MVRSSSLTDDQLSVEDIMMMMMMMYGSFYLCTMEYGMLEKVEVKAVPMMSSDSGFVVRSGVSLSGKSLDLSSYMNQITGSVSSSLTTTSLTPKSPDTGIYFPRQGSVDKGTPLRKVDGSGPPYQVTVKDKMRYHSITMMKVRTEWNGGSCMIHPQYIRTKYEYDAILLDVMMTVTLIIHDGFNIFIKEYEHISFEELRLLSPLVFRSSESMVVRQSSNGSYTAAWTPSCTGPYHLHVTVDGYPVSEARSFSIDSVYFIE